ncbi:MAG: NADH-quinone oxidoreductase subunit J [Pirellulaceae bacterium]|nr:NADH-quinone oxidoreductase subunit J [Pirellulaceae bacterium]
MILLAAIDWHSVLFLFFALVACGFAVAVAATANVVRMAFYLTLSLGATAGLFFLAGSEFVGAMQLMIYVGGTLVLLIFGVMLTAQAKFVSMQTSAGEWVLGGAVGAALLYTLLSAALSVDDWRTPRANRGEVALVEARTSTPIGLALSGVRVDKLNETSEQLRKGMSGYFLPFVIVSMHLLVVLIGAGYMARTKRAGSGLALQAAIPAAAPRDRKRSFFVAVGLVKGLVFNLLLAAACFWLLASPIPVEGDGVPTNAWLKSLGESLAAYPGWLLPTLGGLFIANALLIAVVWLWQRWGVVGLVIVPIVQALVLSNAGCTSTCAGIFLAVMLVPVAATILLLLSGRPSAWSQME